MAVKEWVRFKSRTAFTGLIRELPEQWQAKAQSLLESVVFRNELEDYVGSGGGLISHTTLTDIGTNTHPQIDTHITTANAHITRAEAVWTATEEPTGFPLTNTDGSTLTFNAGTRVVTFTPPLAGSTDYFIKGTKYTISSAKTVTIADSDGMHHIYFDTDSALHTTTTFNADMLSEYCYVCNVLFDSSTPARVMMGDERHGLMPWPTHWNLHNTHGTSYLSGLSLGDITADGDGSLDAHATLSSASGSILDEDVTHSIAAKSSPAQIPILWRTGATGVWNVTTKTNAPIKTTGTGRAAYNEWTGATWQQTEVTNNKFTLTHILATNDVYEPIMAIMGQEEYNSVSDARLGANTEVSSLVTAGLPMQEAVFIGTVIYQTANGYANTWKSRIRTTDEGDDYVSWLGSEITPGVAPSDHQNLTGRDEESQHPASSVNTDTTNFNGNLSGTDTDVQTALETLDDMAAGGEIVRCYSMGLRDLAARRHEIPGYYRAPAADANLTQASATQTLGTANLAYGAHAFLVAGGAGSVDAGSCSIVVSGTSVQDDGTRTTSDTETIVADITAMTLNAYYETSKRWVGQITYTLTPSGASTYSADFNYGYGLYETFNAQSVTVDTFEVSGYCAAADSSFTLKLLLHDGTGWTYSAAAFIPGGTEITSFNTVYSTDDDLGTDAMFGFRRTGLNTAVDGTAGEGIIIQLDTSVGSAIQYANFTVVAS